MNNHIKYPRTYHFPFSNPSTDDKIIHDVDMFNGKNVVVTEKLDGQNVSCYNNFIHNRSLEFTTGEHNTYIKNLWGSIKHNIPDNFRICGEDVSVVHSIKYNNLSHFFYVFSIWNGDICLDWKETQVWCALLGLETVPVIYEGLYNQETINYVFQSYQENQKDEVEGYVVRLFDSFCLDDFNKSVAKWTRKDHIKTDKHWKHQEIKYNEWRKE
jgi:hypothetical protein